MYGLFQVQQGINVCDNTESTTYNDPDGPCCTHILRDMLRTFDDSMSNFGLDILLDSVQIILLWAVKIKCVRIALKRRHATADK